MLDHAVSNTVDTRNIRSQSSLAGIWALGPCRHSLTGVLLRLWGLLALHLQGEDSGKDMGPVRVVGQGLLGMAESLASFWGNVVKEMHVAH